MKIFFVFSYMFQKYRIFFILCNVALQCLTEKKRKIKKNKLSVAKFVTFRFDYLLTLNSNGFQNNFVRNDIPVKQIPGLKENKSKAT